MRWMMVAPALCLFACPSKNEPPETWEDFFDRYCDYAAPCCEEVGRSGSARRCRGGTFLFDTFFFFSPKQAEACLDALDSGNFPADFCEHPGLGFLDCLSTPIDSRPPGATCEVYSECAPEPDARVRCTGAFSDGEGTCQHVFVAGDGAAPCYRFDIDDPMPPALVYECRRENGLFCNPIGRACTRLAEVGETCWDESMCVDGSYCDLSKALCVATIPIGGACEGGIASECGLELISNSAYCDAETKQCVAYLPVGADCSGPFVCASFNCVEGRCAPYPSIADQVLDRLCPPRT